MCHYKTIGQLLIQKASYSSVLWNFLSQVRLSCCHSGLKDQLWFADAFTVFVTLWLMRSAFPMIIIMRHLIILPTIQFLSGSPFIIRKETSGLGELYKRAIKVLSWCFWEMRVITSAVFTVLRAGVLC